MKVIYRGFGWFGSRAYWRVDLFRKAKMNTDWTLDTLSVRRLGFSFGKLKFLVLFY